MIACSADDRYAAPLTVMLKSLELHLRPGVEVDIYVLNAGMRRASRQRMQASLDERRLHLHWIRVPRHVRRFPVFGHVSPATYSRILIPELLPSSVTKAVYLDSDIVVLGDVTVLWEMDMCGGPLLAAQEGDRVVSDPYGIVMYRELGLPADAKYLNAGVLVMDLSKWRADHIQTKIARYLVKYREKVLFWDQDGINAVLATQWRPLGAEWNYRVLPSVPVLDRKAADVVAETLQCARIVHYASGIKPWDPGAVHPANQLFFDYLDFTEWRGWTPSPPRRRRWGRHDYGRYVRGIPLIGAMWALLRRLQKGRW